jgi:hypothetical protein
VDPTGLTIDRDEKGNWDKRSDEMSLNRSNNVEQGRMDSYYGQNAAKLKKAVDNAIHDPDNQKDANGQTHCNNVPPQVLNTLGKDPSNLLNKDDKGNSIATKATDQLNNLSKSS